MIDFFFFFFSAADVLSCVCARVCPWQPGALANYRLNGYHLLREITGRNETGTFGLRIASFTLADAREYAHVVKFVSRWSKRKQQLYLTVER